MKTDAIDDGSQRVAFPRAKARSPVFFLLILLALLASRVPLVVTAFHGSEITTDEPDLSLMALDRYFGVPLTNTHWPAVTNQLLMVPLIGVDFALCGHPKTAGGFAGYAGAQYRDPTRLVVAHRALVVALVSLASVALAWSLRSRGWIVAIAAVLLLQNVHLITYGTLGLGNGPALAAMIGAAACLLHDGCRRKRSLLAGLLLGVAIASRNTSVLLVPIVLGFVCEMSESPRAFARHVALVVLGGLVGGAPAWTSALLEPIRWAKANLGNFVKVGAPAGPGGALAVLLGAAGWWFWSATAAALAWLIFVRRRLVAVVAWLLSFALAVAIGARSPLVETRYFDAIVLGAALVCALAIEEWLGTRRDVARLHTSVRSDRTGVGVVACVALLAALGWWGAMRRFDASRAGLRPDDRVVAASIRSDEGRVIVDRSLLGLLRPRATAASLRDLASGTEAAMLRGEALGEFVTRFKLSPEVAAVFAPNLTEKEQNEVIRTRVAAAAAPLGEPLDVAACGESNSARRYGVMGVAEAIRQVRNGQAAEAVLLADSVATLDVKGLSVDRTGEGKFVRVRRADRPLDRVSVSDTMSLR